VHYYFASHLGSTSVVTNSTGTTPLDEDIDYYPYGGEIDVSNGVPQNYKFTGKERDSESGLDNFEARYYASSLGRFMIPDWAAAPTDVPYANLGNPQSLNLYSYVQNNPTTLGDPDGHGCDTCTEAWDEIAKLVEEGAAEGQKLIKPVAGGAAGRILGGTALSYGAAMLFPSSVGQSDVDERAAMEQAQNEREQQAEPEPPQTSTDSGGSRKRGGENPDAAYGREKHQEFADKVDKKAGWKSQPSLTDPKTGKTVKPDAVSKSGKPVELKPNTASGRAAGRSAIQKYNRATGKKGRVVYYKKKPS
jgi:RHS repeat-associated protein